MTKEELNYKITGTETPRFVSEREDKIIDICLEIINQLEDDKNKIKNHAKDALFLTHSPQVKLILEGIIQLTN